MPQRNGPSQARANFAQDLPADRASPQGHVEREILIEPPNQPSQA
jgi:hypothetical protein